MTPDRNPEKTPPPMAWNCHEAHVDMQPLPPLLERTDGTPVSGPDDWPARRTELLEAFRTHVYGRTPASLPPETITCILPPVPAGHDLPGTLEIHRISYQVGKRNTIGDTTRLHVALWLPRERPAPVFLGLNFAGNHSVHPDPRIPLSDTWISNDYPGTIDHRATGNSRGIQRVRWPLADLLARGYGVATCYAGDIEPDHPTGWKTGLRGQWLRACGRREFADDDWGAIAAWAWGLGQIRRMLQNHPGVGSVAVCGHSRMGKAALWAGAQDERFALVISNNSGAGGASLASRNFGETPAHLNTRFPHWFCANYRRSESGPLVVDQHQLLALVAPRPLHVASATEDLWADPRGEYLALREAGRVYRFLGAPDPVVPDSMPAPDHPEGCPCRYHLRTGPHEITTADWAAFLDFADLVLPRKAAE